MLSHACVYTWHGILVTMVTPLPFSTPPQVQLPCAIGGLGRTASGAVHLPELDGSTAQSHCYKQSHSSWEGVRSSIILLSILLYPITVAPSISLSSMLRSFMALPCYPVDDFTRVLWSGLLMTAIHPCLLMPMHTFWKVPSRPEVTKWQPMN